VSRVADGGLFFGAGKKKGLLLSRYRALLSRENQEHRSATSLQLRWLLPSMGRAVWGLRGFISKPVLSFI
jgi:hypothetical protein